MVRQSRSGVQSRARRAGLTVAEILIALALMAIILVFVIGLNLLLTNSATKGVDQTIATEIAQRLVDEASRIRPTAWILTGGENVTTTDPRTSTVFYYQCAATTIANANTTTTEPMGDFSKYEVTIFWWPEDPNSASISTRVGTGLQKVKLSRLIYISDMHQP